MFAGTLRFLNVSKLVKGKSLWLRAPLVDAPSALLMMYDIVGTGHSPRPYSYVALRQNMKRQTLSNLQS